MVVIWILPNCPLWNFTSATKNQFFSIVAWQEQVLLQSVARIIVLVHIQRLCENVVVIRLLTVFLLKASIETKVAVVFYLFWMVPVELFSCLSWIDITQEFLQLRLHNGQCVCTWPQEEWCYDTGSVFFRIKATVTQLRHPEVAWSKA